MDITTSTLQTLTFLPTNFHNTDQVWEGTHFRVQKDVRDKGITIYVHHNDSDSNLLYEPPAPLGVVRVIYTYSQHSTNITSDKFLQTFAFLINKAIHYMRDTIIRVEVTIDGSTQRVWPDIDGWPAALRAGLSPDRRAVEVAVRKIHLGRRSMEMLVLAAPQDSTTDSVQYVTWWIPADDMAIFGTDFYIKKSPPTEGRLDVPSKRLRNLWITPSAAIAHDHSEATLRKQRKSLLDLLKRAKQDLVQLRLPLYLKESIIDIINDDDLTMPLLMVVTITDNDVVYISSAANDKSNWVPLDPNVGLVDRSLNELPMRVEKDNKWKASKPKFQLLVSKSLISKPVDIAL